MEHWVLACSPLAMRIGNWRVLGKDTTDIPVKQIWVVSKCLCVDSMIVHNDWTIVLKTTANTANDEVDAPSVSKSATGIEVFNWQLTDDGESKEASHLSTSGVVGPVEIGSVNWSGNFFHLAAWEPAS